MARLPTAEEQLLLEEINRFRMNPGAEADLLIGAGAPSSVLSAISYFGVSTSALRSQLAALSPVAPLAWNGNLADAATGHDQAMIAGDVQSHQVTSQGELSLGARVTAAGYNWSALGENVYAFANSVIDGHAGFVIDWGYDAGEVDGSGNPIPGFASTGDGIQDPAGHRINLMNASFTEVGLAVVAENNSSTQVGPELITEDFGTTFNAKAQFVGVVIDDTDKDGFYDIGEGQANVTLTFTPQSGGTPVSTTSWDSGGFQLQLDPGTYTVVATGASLRAPITTTATIGLANVHLTLVEGDAVTTQLHQTRHGSDFNGDGRDDILWRSDSGQLSDWLGQLSGGFIGNDGNAFSQVPTSWKVVGMGDFNGDKRDDILWRSDSGQLSDWLGDMNGGFTTNDANAFTTVATSWSVVGTGDFNGDGKADILWRDSNGQFSDWLGAANGAFAGNDANAFRSVPTSWSVVGTGDFNGDGREDVLWRNSNGQLSDWLGQTNGGFVANDANAFSSVATNWHVVGTGDFNGDGKADILWRSDSGQLSDWLGKDNGGFVGNDANAFVQVPTDWQVVGTGDYNGDGRDDILWRNSNGQLSDWLGRTDGGFTSNDAAALTAAPTNWHVQVFDSFVV